MSEYREGTIVILAGSGRCVARELVRILQLENKPQAIYVSKNAQHNPLEGRQLIVDPTSGPTREQLMALRKVDFSHPGILPNLNHKVDFTSFNPRPNKRRIFKSK